MPQARQLHPFPPTLSLPHFRKASKPGWLVTEGLWANEAKGLRLGRGERPTTLWLPGHSKVCGLGGGGQRLLFSTSDDLLPFVQALLFPHVEAFSPSCLGVAAG